VIECINADALRPNLFPLAEPDFLSDVQVNTPETPAGRRS